MTFKGSLGAATVAFLALAPAAQATTYVCELKPYTRYGWIPPDMVLIVADDRTKALVFDGMVAEVYREPIPARIKVRSQSSLQFDWMIENLQTDRKTSKVNASLTAVLNLATMKITLRVVTQGNDFTPNGGGTCVIRK